MNAAMMATLLLVSGSPNVFCQPANNVVPRQQPS